MRFNPAAFWDDGVLEARLAPIVWDDECGESTFISSLSFLAPIFVKTSDIAYTVSPIRFLQDA